MASAAALIGREIAVDIGPFAGAREADRARALADAETLDRDELDRRVGARAAASQQRPIEPRARPFARILWAHRPLGRSCRHGWTFLDPAFPMLPALSVLGVHRAGRQWNSPASGEPKPAPNRLRGAPPGGCCRAMAGLLARGSPPHAAFPAPASPASSGVVAQRLTAYSCGGSCGIGSTSQDSISILIACARTAFPIHPPLGGPSLKR